MLIRDGSTVVLGGLIRDDIQNLNDKVPLLGDLPLIGRFFQSKAVSNTKRNLIISSRPTSIATTARLLNPPEANTTADVLTGRAGFAPRRHAVSAASYPGRRVRRGALSAPRAVPQGRA
ncbi:MAG: hypothetical protein WDO13_07760 [Verrucomicrobiota bacterium]